MRALTVGRLAAVARMKKYAFITFGVIFLVVGIVALAIPVLPTTPFLILAAYCFSKGSDYLNDWLLNHKWFGPPIKDWRRNGAIKLTIQNRRVARHGGNRRDDLRRMEPRVMPASTSAQIHSLKGWKVEV